MAHRPCPHPHTPDLEPLGVAKGGQGLQALVGVQDVWVGLCGLSALCKEECREPRAVLRPLQGWLLWASLAVSSRSVNHFPRASSLRRPERGFSGWVLPLTMAEPLSSKT